MKRMMTTALVASVLMSLTAIAGPIKGRDDLMDFLSREVKIDMASDAKAMEVDQVHTKLDAIGRVGTMHSSLATAGLTAHLETNEGALNLMQVARTIINSSEVLKDSTKIGNDLDKGANDLKSSIEASNEAYAAGMGTVAGKIHDSSSDSGKAVAKVLLMGREIARGQLTVEQAKSYEGLMRGMSQLLKTGEAKTSEEALSMTLERLGMKKDQKIQELLGCKA